MFDQIDQQLTQWVHSVLDSPSLTVSLQPPGIATGGHGVSLYLQDILPDPPARTARRAPLQVLLRYLVTTWAEDLLAAHRLLGTLLFAAMDVPAYTVELAPQTADVWVSFGVPPQPAFLLLIAARHERPESVAPLVSRPLVMHAAPMVSLHGRVVGPGDMPLPGARVELPALQLAHYTDNQGFFRFAGVPGEPADKLLLIKAKGRELQVTVNHSPSTSDEPLVIHFEPLEK